MARILITGGTGFIGSRLAVSCLNRGDQVRVFGQENNPAETENRKFLEKGGVEVVEGSMTDQEKIKEVVRGMDDVYHLAAAQHEANISDQRFWDVNVDGTRNLLNACVKEGIRRFIHGSTIGVYGSALGGKIDRNSPLRPDNIYGITKLEGEKVVLSYKDLLPVVIIRISETYGPGDRRLLKLFKAIKKKAFFMIGPGENIHHPIYIEDLIQGFFQAAVVEKAVGEIMVLAGKEHFTTKKMVEVIARQLQTEIPSFHAPLWIFMMAAVVLEKTLGPLGIQPPLHRRRMDFFRKSFFFSLDDAVQKLDFNPKYDFMNGVERTAKWYLEMGEI